MRFAVRDDAPAFGRGTHQTSSPSPPPPPPPPPGGVLRDEHRIGGTDSGQAVGEGDGESAAVAAAVRVGVVSVQRRRERGGARRLSTRSVGGGHTWCAGHTLRGWSVSAGGASAAAVSVRAAAGAIPHAHLPPEHRRLGAHLSGCAEHAAAGCLAAECQLGHGAGGGAAADGRAKCGRRAGGGDQRRVSAEPGAV
eukprot:ctg_165.g62